MAKPASYNLEIYQGDTFKISTRIISSVNGYLDLTGWVGRSQIRRSPESEEVLAEFNVSVDELDATTLNVSLDATTTATLPATNNRTLWVWDLELTDPIGNVTTYFRGFVTVIAEVTR